MKLILDPDGTAIDLAKRPLWVESIKVTPGKKKIDLLTNPYTDGAVPFGKSATDVMTMEIDLRVDEMATLEEGLAELRAVSQLLDEVENQLPSGMPLEETPDNSETPSTAYVLMGEITELPREQSGDQLGWYHKAPFARIVLTCEPFYEGPEEEAGSVEGETPLLELTINNVKGDVDALGLAVITAKGGQNFRHVEVGLESRFYDSASKNATLLKADAMTVAGYAGALAAPSGWTTHSTQVVKATLVNQPVVVCSTGALAHIGQWREKLRFKASTTDVYVRLAWRVGHGPWGRGDWVKAPVATTAVEQFLDAVNIPQAPAGTTQRWEGQIEAMATTSAATLEIDILESIPAQSWQQVRAPALLNTAKAFKIRDDFIGAGVFMTGTKEEMGNTYVKLGHASEDADDFLVVATDDFTSRAVGGPETFGRAVGVAVGLAKTAVSIDMAQRVLTDDAARMGFLVRTVNSLNYLKVQTQALGDTGTSPGPATLITVELVTGGVVQASWSKQIAASLLRPNSSTNYLRVVALVVGEEFLIFAGPKDGAQPLVLQGFHALLGTTLAAGGVYLWDRQTEATATSRGWTRFRVWEPEVGAVAYSGRDLRIDYQTAERYDSEGKYLSPVYEYRGKDFTLPPSGDRKRKVRVVSKARINDVDNEFDTLTGIKHKLTVFYRPRYRFPRDS